MFSFNFWGGFVNPLTKFMRELDSTTFPTNNDEEIFPIIFPKNTPILGQNDFGYIYCVRKCYCDLWREVSSKIHSDFLGDRGILLTGNPGTGKSFFAVYALKQLLEKIHKGKNVICHDNKSKVMWLIKRDCWNGLHARNCNNECPELLSSDNYYIFDAGADSHAEPLMCNARTIVLSSPDSRHYKEWMKVHTSRVYMPVWNIEELSICHEKYQELYQNPEYSFDLNHRFNKFGGIPRFVLAKQSNYPWDERLKHIIRSPNLGMMIQVITSEEPLLRLTTEVSHMLFHYEVDQHFRATGIRFASEYIAQEVQQFVEQSAEEMKSVLWFLEKAADIPLLASLRGKLFELYAHKQLLFGGEFNIRDEENKSSSLTLVPSQNADKEFKYDALILQDDSDWKNLTLNSYGRPFKQNQPSIDAVMLPNRFFQYTVSSSHHIDWTGLCYAIDRMKSNPLFQTQESKEIDFIFVVPPDVYDEFKIPQSFTNKPRGTREHRPRHTRLRKFVMKFPIQPMGSLKVGRQTKKRKASE